jgi:hypothetical protein
MAEPLASWMLAEQNRWKEYGNLLTSGVNDLQKNDFGIQRAQNIDRSVLDSIRADGRESRQRERYGVPDPTGVIAQQRGVDKGLARALNNTDVLNRAQVQQYDADKQFANQLIGIGHGVGSTADELRASITSAKQAKDDAYKNAKNAEKIANQQARQQTTQAVLTTAVSIIGAAMG